MMMQGMAGDYTVIAPVSYVKMRPEAEEVWVWRRMRRTAVSPKVEVRLQTMAGIAL